MRYTYSYITLHYWPHKGISAYQLEYGKGSWPNNCLGIRSFIYGLTYKPSLPGYL